MHGCASRPTSHLIANGVTVQFKRPILNPVCYEIGFLDCQRRMTTLPRYGCSAFSEMPHSGRNEAESATVLTVLASGMRRINSSDVGFDCLGTSLAQHDLHWDHITSFRCALREPVNPRSSRHTVHHLTVRYVPGRISWYQIWHTAHGDGSFQMPNRQKAVSF